MDPANLALTGQAPCIKALRHIVQSGGFGHALLLASYDDVALDAVANWCSERIVCSANQSEPCGKCLGCASLKRKDGLTLYHATLGERQSYAVEDMREIRSHLALRAQQPGRRVVRIDNIESCTIPAANALLKVLEEPGLDVTFILTTEAPARVLATIRSRAMLYRLQPVPRKIMESVLAENGVSKTNIETVIAAAPGQLGRAAALAASDDALAALRSVDKLAETVATQTLTNKFQALAKTFETKQDSSIQRQQVRSIFAAFSRRAESDPWVQQRLGRLLTGLQNLQTNSQPRLILEAFVT
jgi:DNA polymerase III gamma/tau subunit